VPPRKGEGTGRERARSKYDLNGGGIRDATVWQQFWNLMKYMWGESAKKNRKTARLFSEEVGKKTWRLQVQSIRVKRSTMGHANDLAREYHQEKKILGKPGEELRESSGPVLGYRTIFQTRGMFSR